MKKNKNLKRVEINKAGDLIFSKQNIKKAERKGIPSEYFSLGTYLAVPLLIAVFLGPWLDKKFQSGNLVTLSLLVFGTISVFYNLYKLYKKG